MRTTRVDARLKRPIDAMGYQLQERQTSPSPLYVVVATGHTACMHAYMHPRPSDSLIGFLGIDHVPTRPRAA